MKKGRMYYRALFKGYPDLVTVSQFQDMLGGVGICFARKLIHENRVQYVFVKPSYYISKASVIDYVLSEDYANRRLKVRV